MDYITRLCDMLEFVNNTIISETYYNESGKVLIEKNQNCTAMKLIVLKVF